ncbi:unnamed protein product, partial [Ectocarpus fasciculatus]
TAICTSPRREAVEAELQAALAKPFAHADMVSLIQSSHASAPGLTGAGYQLLKLLPEAATRKLFHLMHFLWRTEKRIPRLWKYKGLHGIPKPAIPHIRSAADLRPIGLIEVTRKLWTKMVLSRITKALHHHQVLQPQHCGGLGGRGTDTAMLQTLNMLEHMQEDWQEGADPSDREVHLDFMSWDTKKAFDSVGNHVQYLAWRRAGVPSDTATWLLRLDLGGRFVALTPYANIVLKATEAGPPSARYEAMDRIGTKHDRGLTQGDVKSPLGWILVFDILLTALNQCLPDLYPKAPVAGPHCYPLLPLAYLDDLTSLTCFRHHTQALADLVSGFNLVMGMQFAAHKFRASSTLADSTPVIVHDREWTPTEVTLAPASERSTVLGIPFALDYTWETQGRQLQEKVRGIAKLLRPSKASPLTKATVLVASTLEAMTYVTSLSAWPTAVLRNLRSTVSQLLREVLGLGPTYPAHLLYCTVGGMGLTDIVTAALKSRARILTRCLHGPWPASGAARGLLER